MSRTEGAEANEFAARHVASSVLGRLAQLGEPVPAAASDEDLRRACGRGKVAEDQLAVRPCCRWWWYCCC